MGIIRESEKYFILACGTGDSREAYSTMCEHHGHEVNGDFTRGPGC